MPREGVLRRAAQAAILAYRYTLSPFLHLCGVRCRHEPSCSAYALQAYRRHSLVKATRLTFRRVTNCRPGGTSGYDPVPEIEPMA
ncbi:MAG: membrane protein insertion efficiency factor YidD [Pseudomonadota bacterium]